MGWDQDDAFADLPLRGHAGHPRCRRAALVQRIGARPPHLRRPPCSTAATPRCSGAGSTASPSSGSPSGCGTPPTGCWSTCASPAVLAAMTELGLDADAPDAFDAGDDAAGERARAAGHPVRRAARERCARGWRSWAAGCRATRARGSRSAESRARRPAAGCAPSRRRRRWTRPGWPPAASGARLAALWLEGADPAAAGGRVFAGLSRSAARRALLVRAGGRRQPPVPARCAASRPQCSTRTRPAPGRCRCGRRAPASRRRTWRCAPGRAARAPRSSTAQTACRWRRRSCSPGTRRAGAPGSRRRPPATRCSRWRRCRRPPSWRRCPRPRRPPGGGWSPRG